MKRFISSAIICLLLGACGPSETTKVRATVVAQKRTNNDNIRQQRMANSLGPDRLSEYGFFTGRLADLSPAEGVVPYDINMPLFSDYAGKSRFISVPVGSRIGNTADGSFEFPEGTRLIKTFHYPTSDGSSQKLLETRIIEKKQESWTALTYIWNDEQTEAFLEVAGGNIDVEWSQNGVLKNVNYSVPNINQCKTCHGRKGAIVPLGPKLAQLDKPFTYPNGVTANQLEHWVAMGILDPQASSVKIAPFPSWDLLAEDKNYLEPAARAYLDSNCGSCHHPEGSANTSGLFLTFDVSTASRYGVMKKPVAAGKGSGGRLYGIVPGKPNESILLYRMESTDPGVMMPELGRSLAHEEGVGLIRQWIESLEQGAAEP